MVISTTIALHSLGSFWWGGYNLAFLQIFNAAIMRTRRTGFTLVELVIVIAIIGILASLSVPKFINLSGAAKISATKAGLGALRSVLAVKYAESATGGAAATFPTTISASDFAGDSPKNALQTQASNTVVTAVTTTQGGTVTNATAGFWYVSGPTNSAVYGKAGAYTDSTATDTSSY